MKRILFALAAMLAAVQMSFAAVDVNKATPAELDSVKGIGPVMSKAIVDERAKGQFKDWNDMVSRVKGVGEANAKKLSESGLTVGGKAFAGAPASAPAVKDAKPAAAAGTKEAPKADAKLADAKTTAPAAATAKDAKPAEMKKDPKADAKAKADADKKAKDEAKAKAADDKKAKAEADNKAKVDAAKKPAAAPAKDVKVDAKADAKPAAATPAKEAKKEEPKK